jgi:hypothetical protein
MQAGVDSKTVLLMWGCYMGVTLKSLESLKDQLNLLVQAFLFVATADA